MWVTQAFWSDEVGPVSKRLKERFPPRLHSGE